MIQIYAFKDHVEATIPTIAYDSTSACFDITCVATTTILAGQSAVVPNGLRLVIDEADSYWMQIQLRSSKGFKHELIPHYGTIDAGYTGELGIKIYNVGKVDVTIEKGERYAQIAVFEKPQYAIVEVDFAEFCRLQENQSRGVSGFGSTGK